MLEKSRSVGQMYFTLKYASNLKSQFKQIPEIERFVVLVIQWSSMTFNDSKNRAFDRLI